MVRFGWCRVRWAAESSFSRASGFLLLSIIYASSAIWKFPSEVVEDPKQVAIQVCGNELVKIPRFRFWRGNNSCTAIPPRLIQLIDRGFALEVNPDHRRRPGNSSSAIGSVGQKKPATASRHLPDAVGSPVPMETK